KAVPFLVQGSDAEQALRFSAVEFLLGGRLAGDETGRTVLIGLAGGAGRADQDQGEPEQGPAWRQRHGAPPLGFLRGEHPIRGGAGWARGNCSRGSEDFLARRMERG